MNSLKIRATHTFFTCYCLNISTKWAAFQTTEQRNSLEQFEANSSKKADIG